MTKPRIAICGIHIESSTFTPYVSNEEDFEVLRGEEVLGRYRWINDDWSRQVDWFSILHARALPGGVVSRNAYGGWNKKSWTASKPWSPGSRWMESSSTSMGP